MRHQIISGLCLLSFFWTSFVSEVDPGTPETPVIEKVSDLLRVASGTTVEMTGRAFQEIYSWRTIEDGCQLWLKGAEQAKALLVLSSAANPGARSMVQDLSYVLDLRSIRVTQSAEQVRLEMKKVGDDSETVTFTVVPASRQIATMDFAGVKCQSPAKRSVASDRHKL